MGTLTDPMMIYLLLLLVTVIPLSMAILAYWILRIRDTVEEAKVVGLETHSALNHKLDEWHAALLTEVRTITNEAITQRLSCERTEEKKT